MENSDLPPKIHLEAIKIAGILDKIDLEEDKMHTPRNVNVRNISTKELLEGLKVLLPDNPDAIKQLEARFHVES